MGKLTPDIELLAAANQVVLGPHDQEHRARLKAAAEDPVLELDQRDHVQYLAAGALLYMQAPDAEALDMLKELVREAAEAMKPEASEPEFELTMEDPG